MRNRKKKTTSRRISKGIRFDVVTLFPGIFDSFLNESLVRRARKNGILNIHLWNLRAYASDLRRTVDERPFGGGPGMVLKVEPVYKAVSRIAYRVSRKKEKMKVILLSPRGRTFDAKMAERFSRYDRLILLCGRYEGVDERVARYIADEEISVGNYVVNGGEVPAMACIEAISRFVPGFLGKYDSLEEKRGSYPAYTRPVEFIPRGKHRGPRAWKVPPVLISGDHKKIETWRRAHGVR